MCSDGEGEKENTNACTNRMRACVLAAILSRYAYDPTADTAALAGLPPGRNILERYALLHTHYSPKYCVFTVLYVRWTKPNGGLKYTQLIPEGNEAPDEAETAEDEESVRTKRRKPNKLTNKGARYI